MRKISGSYSVIHQKKILILKTFFFHDIPQVYLFLFPKNENPPTLSSQNSCSHVPSLPQPSSHSLLFSSNTSQPRNSLASLRMLSSKYIFAYARLVRYYLKPLANYELLR